MAEPAQPRVLRLLSKLIGGTLLASAGSRVGVIHDFIVKLAEGGYPKVTGMEVRAGDRSVFVSMRDLKQVGVSEFQLKTQNLSGGPFERRAGEVLLKRDIAGHHLVDVTGGRIIRASDLALEERGDDWYLAGVVRRRTSPVGRILGRVSRRGPQERIGIIDWKDLQPFVSHVPTAKLLMPLQRLRRLHPAQIADLVESATHEEGEEIIASVEQDHELVADVFEELDSKHQQEFISTMTNDEAAALLSRMEPDHAADLLTEIEQARRIQVFDLLPPAHQHRLRALLQYHPETAGGLMTPDFIAVTKGTTVGEALNLVRAHDKIPPHLGAAIFVVDDDGRYAGTVHTADLLEMDARAPVEDDSSLTSPSVRVSADLAKVALTMADFNLIILAVVDPSGVLVGAVTSDDLLEALVPDQWRRREAASSGE